VSLIDLRRQELAKIRLRNGMIVGWSLAVMGLVIVIFGILLRDKGCSDLNAGAAQSAGSPTSEVRGKKCP
jgi:hypothetical protein